MRLFLKIFFLFTVVNVFSQNTNSTVETSAKIDSLYREDQFYFGFTYNTLQRMPAGLNQSKFSTGFSMGFVRDMPINKKRTLAIASGIGLSYNTYNQNLAITKPNQIPIYTIIDSEIAYSKNRFTQLAVDVPIEFRWRTSTFESHKFWRIYGGIKLSYLVYDKSIFENAQGKTVVTGNDDFNKLRYGAYISSGYNSVNVYAYYGLNSVFKSAKINNTTTSIDMNSMNIGIIFYIL
jgi:hypothetical protein